MTRNASASLPRAAQAGFEPGQTSSMGLVVIAGKREAVGFRGEVMGKV